MPKVAILGKPSLDLEKVKVFSNEGIFRSDATVKEGYELANEAQQQMTEEAISEGILQKSTNKCGTVFEKYVWFSRL
ncbi:DUF4230 domain-containing protein [Kurthia senegalensis]|uniref:DUF4230 domain-containing protein n=1 Tax=Kurthia senegalensis TaxID=1033740 RepID=UPI000289FAB2|nr:DUF4230 domain-containing protein [Kurthia senegalensis]